jgi:tripartite-type tricarboxylate transporter receptor subunit TctC
LKFVVQQIFNNKPFTGDNMKTNFTRRTTIAAALIALTAFTSVAQAQTYPQRPIRIVVGFPGGTGPDIVTRIVSNKLQELLGQSVVVDNKAGAGGLIGAAEVAKAAPDGYTLYMGTVAEMAIAPSTYNKLSYSPTKDFAGISHLATADFGLVIPATIPANNLKEYVDWSRKQKDQFMSTFGAGTPGHFGIAILNDAAKLNIEPVHFKSTGDAMTAVITGETHGLFGTLALIAPNVKGGKLRAIATTGSARSTVLPDVPTAKEQGFPAVEFDAWFGLFAPVGAPSQVLDKLNNAVVLALQAPEVKDKLVGAGMRVTGSSRAQLELALKEDVARWQTVVKKTGFKAQD